MKKLIGYCGIDCEKCDVYIATKNNDQELRKKTAEYWSKLNNVQIPVEAMYCTGCRMDGVKTVYCDKMCQIKKCAEQKKKNCCNECEAWQNCPTLKMITEHNSDAMDNLLKETK